MDIFCLADEFCQKFTPFPQRHSLGNRSKRPPVMSQAEIITKTVIFHLSRFRCFKQWSNGFKRHNDELRNMCQIEPTRQHSTGNFFTNLIDGLIAYSLFP